MKKPDSDYDETAAMQAAQERSGEQHLRHILTREFDEAQTRPHNEAYELWRDAFEGNYWRDIEERKKQFRRQEQQPAPTEPKRDGPDIELLVMQEVLAEWKRVVGDMIERDLDEYRRANGKTYNADEAVKQVYAKWMDAFEDFVWRDHENRIKLGQKSPAAPEPKRDGPDMDMD